MNGLVLLDLKAKEIGDYDNITPAGYVVFWNTLAQISDAPDCFDDLGLNVKLVFNQNTYEVSINGFDAFELQLSEDGDYNVWVLDSALYALFFNALPKLINHLCNKYVNTVAKLEVLQ